MSEAGTIFGQLPAGCSAVPVLPGQEQSPLKICAIFRAGSAGPLAGGFILLRDRWDARIYLGAVTDAADRVHGWVEIWIQTVETPPVSMTARGQMFNNLSLNQNWSRQADALDASDTLGLIRTGYEQSHPMPLFVDSSGIGHSPAMGTEPLILCQDDAVLMAAGLPAFSSSLERYLYIPTQAQAGPFVPLTSNAPSNARTVSLAEIMPNASPFNPGGGLVIVRRHAPLDFEQFLSLLEAGEPGMVDSFSGASGMPNLMRPFAADSATPHDGRLLTARQGKAGQWIETFYLKICAWAGALDSLQRATERLGRPVLNLSPQSFRVSLGKSRHGLPSLWNHDVALCDPGDALPLQVENAQRVYFVRELGARGESAPVYRPALAMGASTGAGDFRIRQVMSEGRGIVVEGTFTPRDRLSASRNDLLRVRIGLAAGRVNLFVQLQPEQAMASGEWRVRTIPQALGDELATQLKAAEGVQLGTVEYEHLPLLSVPADAYAMAVLLLRMLMVRADAPLATVVDEAWSLAREVAATYDPSVPLPQRIAAIFSGDPRWNERLGSQYAAGVGMMVLPDMPSPLPKAIWWDTLALIVSLLPGAGADSFFTDYGDAPPNALHRAYEIVLVTVDDLLTRIRSVLMVDWRMNEELGSVVRSMLRGITPMRPAQVVAPPPPSAPQRAPVGAIPLRKPAPR